MVKNTFLSEEFPKYLEEITGTEKPSWGMMSIQHMIEHLSLMFVISNGKINAPSFYPADSQARKKARFIEGGFAFPKNFNPTKAENAGSLKYESLAQAKNVCLKAHAAFFKHFEENPDSHPNHPVMGLFSFEDWQNFHEHHIKHHFTQFGILEDKTS